MGQTVEGGKEEMERIDEDSNGGGASKGRVKGLKGRGRKGMRGEE